MPRGWIEQPELVGLAGWVKRRDQQSQGLARSAVLGNISRITRPLWFSLIRVLMAGGAFEPPRINEGAGLYKLIAACLLL
jgi:hypothetical protein